MMTQYLMKISPLFMTLMTLGILATCGIGCDSSSERASGANGTAKKDEDTISVPVLTPTPSGMARRTTQPATVHAWYEARIHPKVTGYVAELKTDIGHQVKAGDVLAVISVPELEKQRQARLGRVNEMEADERRADAQMRVAKAAVKTYQAKVASAHAGIDIAKAELTASTVERDRKSGLVSRGAISDRLLDEAKERYDSAEARKADREAMVLLAEAQVTLGQAEVSAAEAELEVARARTEVARRELDEIEEMLQYTKLVAPFDGTVTIRHIEPGDLVRASGNSDTASGRPLIVVSQIDPVRVRVSVPERDTPFVESGDQARIILQALPTETFTGTVSRVSGVLDEKTRTMLVEIDLPNPEGRLAPGMFGQATIDLEDASPGLRLPVNAVRYDEKGNARVMLLDSSSRVAVRDVVVGEDDGEWVEILSGVTDSDRVIGATLQRLSPGQQVRVR